MMFSRFLFGNVSLGCNFMQKLQLFVFLFFVSVATVVAQRQPPPMAARSAGSAGDHLVEAMNDTERRLIDSYKKTADRLIGANEINEATRYLNKIAYMYWDKGHLQEAAQIFRQSLQLTQQTNNINGLAMLNNNLGMIYSDNENYDKALEYFGAALAQRKKQKNKVGIVSSLINMSNAYANMQQYGQAIKYLEEALPAAQEANDDRLVAQCYGTLAQIHQKAGNAEKSIYYFKFYASFEQRIQDAEIKRREEQSQQKMQEVALHMKEIESEKLEKEQELKSKADSLKRIDVALHDLEKRAAKEAKTHQIMIDLLNKEEKIKELRLKEKDNQLRYEAYIRYFILLMLAMMIGSAYFFYKSYKQKQKDHAKLAEQNVAIVR
ncbi:MAG: tetratricopeptide repeat protein, partial [Thermoflexibacteraceae bacterium]